MKSPNKDYIHDPKFRHSGLVSSSGVVWCWNSRPYMLSRWRHLPTRCKYSCGKWLPSTLFKAQGLALICQASKTKPLTITIVSGNDFRIFPRNVMACFTHVFSQNWFWAVKIRNGPLMFFHTCAKLTFCLTQIYFLAITAWYRVYSMCFLISRNAILGFRKNMSQCLKEF